MALWRIMFGLSLMLGSAALVSGWILLRQLKPQAWAFVPGGVLGLLGLITPSAMAGIMFAVVLGILLPIVLALLAELVSRRHPAAAIAQPAPASASS